MRRLVLVAAFALALTGCNALGSPATDRPTVTPAPVPDEPSTTATATTADRTCIGPAIAGPDGRTRTPPAVPEVAAALAAGSPGTPAQSGTPATPTGVPTAAAAPLAARNGTVDGETLVERHVAALSNHSYRLRTDVHDLWVTAGGSAFTYRSVGYDWTQVRAYAVDGRLYTYVRTEYDTLAVTERRYRGDLAGADTLPTLTVRRWLLTAVVPFDFRVVGERVRDGTRIRVLRAANGTAPTGVRNVTLALDRRGIIRTATAERSTTGAPSTQRTTYAVTRLDGARPFRPAAFCRSDWVDATVRTLAPATAEAAPAAE